VGVRPTPRIDQRQRLVVGTVDEVALVDDRAGRIGHGVLSDLRQASVDVPRPALGGGSGGGGQPQAGRVVAEGRGATRHGRLGEAVVEVVFERVVAGPGLVAVGIVAVVDGRTALAAGGLLDELVGVVVLVSGDARPGRTRHGLAGAVADEVVAVVDAPGRRPGARRGAVAGRADAVDVVVGVCDRLRHSTPRGDHANRVAQLVQVELERGNRILRQRHRRYRRG